MTITLEMKKALPKMIKAFNERRLGIQTRKTECRYRYDDGSCCIIGAAINDKVAKQFDSIDGSSCTLTGLEIKKLVNGNDLWELRRIQRMHDEGCEPGADRKAALKELKHALNEQAQKYKLRLRAA